MLGQLSQRRLSRIRNLPLGSPPLTIGPIELNGNLFRSPFVFVQKKLPSRIGPVEPPRGIDPRSKPEPQITLIEPTRIAFRGRKQRSHPAPLSPPHLLEPPLDQRPILADQRHYIGHRGKSDQVEVEVVRGGVPKTLKPAPSRAFWGPRPGPPPQRTGQLPSHTGTAEL